MPLLHLLILAIVQGITEFLPVSSSGHLILLPKLMGVADQGQLIDVSVHIGTLGAVILFFWTDSKSAFTGLAHLAVGRFKPRRRGWRYCWLSQPSQRCWWG